jgi:hypothetical protein
MFSQIPIFWRRTMAQVYTVQARAISKIVVAVAEAGVPVAALYQAAQLDPAELHQSRACFIALSGDGRG